MDPGPGTEHIWGRMHDRLLSFIRGRVASVEDAEDILQDVFLHIHSKPGTLKDTDSITAWTYRITRNAIIDYHRARAKGATIVDGSIDGAPDPADVSPDVERRAVREFSDCVAPMLAELPEHYRQAVTLTELSGMSQVEAARKLGLSVSGMKTRVQRGRGKLKDVLLDCCTVEFDRRGGLLDYRRRRGGACGEGCDCSPS